MKYHKLALLTALVLMVLACGSSKTPALAAATSSRGPTHYLVVMTDYRFAPDSLNVMTGDTVTWANRGRAAHTTTSGTNGNPNGKWDSRNVQPGGSYSHVFTAAGTLPYYCSPHVSMGMKGVIVVIAR